MDLNTFKLLGAGLASFVCTELFFAQSPQLFLLGSSKSEAVSISAFMASKGFAEASTNPHPSDMHLQEDAMRVDQDRSLCSIMYNDVSVPAQPHPINTLEQQSS